MSAAMVTTPVRKTMTASEYSNESPLPTPPQAQHDLIRNGRTARRSSQQHLSYQSNHRHTEDDLTLLNDIAASRGNNGSASSSNAYPPPLGESHGHLISSGDHLVSRQSSSSPTSHSRPNAQPPKPFSATVGAALTSISTTNNGRGSPSSGSLAASLGTSLASTHRSALGSQMGIHASAHDDARSAASSSQGILRTSNNRPSVLHSNRSASYESAANVVATKTDRLAPAGGRDSGGRTAAAKDKENIDHVNRLQYRLPGEDQAHTSLTARRSTSRKTRSPSPTGSKVDLHRTGSAFTRSTYRRTSAEDAETARIAAETAGRDKVLGRRPSDEQHDLEWMNHDEEAQKLQTRESTFHTPAFAPGSRVLRSGQASRHGAAPWSVGRSIKRIDRHTGPDKPPQRVVAQALGADDEEEEEEEESTPERDGNSVLPSPIAEERTESANGESEERDRRRNAVRKVSTAGLRDAVNLVNGDRDAQLHVPLGADEDEDEDDVYQESLQRAPGGSVKQESFLRRGTKLGNVAASGQSGPFDSQAQRRRTAINDILSAKVPADSGPRRVLATSFADPSIASSLSTNASAPRIPGTAPQGAAHTQNNFMSLVQQEAQRQRNVPFLYELSSKPSKDLETKFNGYKFKKVRKAGEGGFSTVWIVRGPFAAPDPSTAGAYINVAEKDQAYFAMKQVTLKKMEQVSREEVLEECNLLQMLASKPDNDDFILRFFGWKSSTGSLKILLELGEEDFNHILRAQRLTHDQIVTFWFQMVEAVQFTHEQGIVHTDLKPANFLMANGRLKLIDFGIAQKIPVGTIHIKRDAMIGTPNYMSPENLSRATAGKVYKAGKASDVWALGCILYQMVYGRPPFESFHGDDKLREILDPNHKIDFNPMRYGPQRRSMSSDGLADENDGEEGEEDVLENVDGQLLDVMRHTLTYAAGERITIPQVLDHPLLRPFAQQRAAQAQGRHEDHDDNDGEEVEVPITKSMMRDILRKMYVFARNGELHDDNLDERADALFDNMLDRHRQRLGSAKAADGGDADAQGLL